MNSNQNFNVNDVRNLVEAAKMANRKGAFELYESAHIAISAQRLEQWITQVEEARSGEPNDNSGSGFPDK